VCLELGYGLCKYMCMDVCMTNTLLFACMLGELI
jgi:hypothetical protein